MRVGGYPYVISGNYGLISREERAHDRFRQIVRTFAATLKFLSVTALAEYLSRPDGFDDGVDEFLADRNSLGRPSLGQFADLLRRIMKASTAREGDGAAGRPRAGAGKTWLAESSIGGLADVLGRRKPRKGFWSAVGHLIHVRNLYIHSDIVPDDRELARLVEENQRALDGLLERLDWMADGELLLVREEGDTFLCREKLLPYPGTDVPTEPGAWWRWRGRSVFLPPFLIGKLAQSGSGDDVDRVLQYETLQGKQIKYLFGRQAMYVSEAELFAALQDVIIAARARRPETSEAERPLGGGEKVEADWDRIVASAEARSRLITDLHYGLRKYSRGAYARRAGIEDAFAGFLESDRRLFVLVGDSGCGKTNLLCRLTQDLLSARHAVLHYYGRLYQGEPLVDMLARDLVWDRANLAGQLKACSDLEPVRRGKRLVVLVDAVNEYSRPEALFREVLKLVEARDLPPWVKVAATFRPVPWEHVEVGFQPNYDLVYAREPSGPGERAPYFTLGMFTDDELEMAWEKWKVVKDLPEGSELPAEITPLLRHPILFRCYAEALSGRKGGTPADLPRTPEEILLRRFGNLEETSRVHVQTVVEAMWRHGKDFLASDEYVGDPRVEEWMTSDRGDDEMAIYACPDHPGREYDERRFERTKECDQCGRPLIKFRAQPIKHPLDYLRDEGILTLYTLGDGDQLLRFTFDRMYEALTGRHVLDLIAASDDPARTLSGFVKANAAPDKAAVMSAVRTAVLMQLHRERGKGEALLELLAAEPASAPRQDFLRAVLVGWAERDAAAALSLARRMAEDGLGAWRKRRKFVSGLQAGVVALARLLAEARAGRSVGDESASDARRLLVDGACDPKLAVDWEKGGIPMEARAALASVSPNDLCLQQLFDYCSAASRRGSTEDALAVVREIASRMHGLRGVFRNRKRMKPVLNWLTRLVTTEIRNRDLAAGFVKEARSFLASLPFLGPRVGRIGRVFRAALLRLASPILFSITDERIARLVETIPPDARKYPDLPPPTLGRLLHVTPDVAEDYAALLELFTDVRGHLSDSDVGVLLKAVSPAYDEPCAGIIRALGGSTTSQHAMVSPIGFIRQIHRFDAFLCSTYSFALPAVALMWGLFHRRQAHMADRDAGAIRELLRRMLRRNRKHMLSRYEVSGQHMVAFCAIQFAEVYRDDGDMPYCKRFVKEAIDAGDWPVAARFWDQVLFPALQRPKSVLRYLEETLEFRPERIVLGSGESPVEVGLVDVMHASAGMAEYYRPGFDLGSAARPEVAVAHLLGTIGSIGLAFPRELQSFLGRKEASAGWATLINELAHPVSVGKLRDERMMAYFANHAVFEFPQVRELLVTALGTVYRDAERRGFREPTRKDLRRLLGDVLDKVLDMIHGPA